MESNHVPADLRWAIANWPDDAERGQVSRFCERHGISRSVFYKIRRQVLTQGLVGATEPGSRRPHRIPRQIDPAVIEHALAVRPWLAEQGLCRRRPKTEQFGRGGFQRSSQPWVFRGG